jgi:hypothetical protein
MQTGRAARRGLWNTTCRHRSRVKMHLLAFTLFGLLAASVPQPEAAISPAPDPNASVAIFASVRARELRFEQVPNVRITATASNTERTNLPEQVQPYVTYRDIGIRLTITSTLPNIEQILDEALGPPNE